MSELVFPKVGWKEILLEGRRGGVNYTRREFLAWISRSLVALGLTQATDGLVHAESPAPKGGMPTRPLGRTGHQVTIVGLGGEGVMRSTGRMKEAVPVIRKALELGINYFDTAPAYEQSQDYLGEGLGADRKGIFLAAKTHDRGRDGSLRLLENSLHRLKTDHLDLWQLHDLRAMEELDEIFSKDGTIHAMEKAKSQGLVRFLGVTGHTDPGVLREAIRRYPFDTALVSINAADRARASFIEEFLPAAKEKDMGIIAMKVMARGLLLEDPVRLTPAEAIRYVLSFPVSTTIIGCWTPQQVEENVQVATAFQMMTAVERSELEERARPFARQLTSFKGAWRSAPGT